MQTIQNSKNKPTFVLRDCSVVCPECSSVFATRILEDLPAVTEFDIIEADLHRVLPDPALRGALITVCSTCHYADWSARFTRSIVNPEILAPVQQIAHAAKFAMAVKYAREKDLHPLDIAYIAANGLYCAREAGERVEPWLELCVYEQNRGLKSDWLPVETGTDHLLMAELWRQIRYFDRAIQEYKKAAVDNSVPMEIIDHQIMVSRAGDSQPTILPPYIVCLVFPDAAQAALDADADAADIRNPEIIVRGPNLETSHAALARNAKWRVYLGSDLGVDFEAGEGDAAEEDFDTIAPELASQSIGQSTTAPQAVAESITTPQAIAEPTTASPAVAESAAVPQAAQAEATSAAANEATQTTQEAVPMMPGITPSMPIAVLQNGGVTSVSIAISSFVNESKNSQVHSKLEPEDNLEPVTNERFPGASNPDAQEDRTHSAVERALKETKGSNSDKFPYVQICDEDAGMQYIRNQVRQGQAPEAYQPPAQQPAAQQQTAQHQGVYQPTAQQQAAQHQGIYQPTAQQQAAHHQAAAYQPAEEQPVQQPAAPAQTPVVVEWLVSPPPAQPSQQDVQQPAQAQSPAVQQPYDDSQQQKDPTAAIAQVESFLNLTRQPSYQNWIRGYRK